tara:strand:+ start:7115 stop:7582 length:468 start_codon:yes stop_codon:yes gene_type:complete
MKTRDYILLALSLFLIIFFAVSSKGQNTQKEETVFVAASLQPFVFDFIKEARKRGFDPLDRIISLDSIKFKNDNRTLGLYANNNVYINPFLNIDSHIIKVVVFHELFHAVYKMPHCHKKCNHLMGAYKPENFTFSLYYNDEIWQTVLDIEFNRIK